MLAVSIRSVVGLFYRIISEVIIHLNIIYIGNVEVLCYSIIAALSAILALNTNIYGVQILSRRIYTGSKTCWYSSGIFISDHRRPDLRVLNSSGSNSPSPCSARITLLPPISWQTQRATSIPSRAIENQLDACRYFMVRLGY